MSPGVPHRLTQTSRISHARNELEAFKSMNPFRTSYEKQNKAGEGGGGEVRVSRNPPSWRSRGLEGPSRNLYVVLVLDHLTVGVPVITQGQRLTDVWKLNFA